MTPEAAAAVLAEPVAQEIEQDVLAPAEQIEQGTDALMEAEADAGLLENTAQILEDASGETATDVDVATPELANITVERISAKYGMARTAVLSKESLGAAAGRVRRGRGRAMREGDQMPPRTNGTTERLRLIVGLDTGSNHFQRQDGCK